MAVSVNTGAVVQTAQRIRTINRQLQAAYSEVDSAVRSLSQEWCGKAGEEAVASLRGIKMRYVDARSESVERLAQFLIDRVAAQYDATEERRKMAASAFR